MIISSDGYILTNNHVIEGSDKLEVAVDMPDGSSKTHQAKVIGTDPLTDVALIKIEVNNLPSAILSDSAKLRVGDVVLAAGAPMELAHSVTMGIVSAIGRKDIGIVRGEGRNRGFEDFIQTDASINPGNSGGPLVDAMGRVVGINTAIFSRSGMNAGIGFAIPIKMALTVVEDLLDDGKVSRGYLGVQIKDLDLDTAKDLGLTEQGGAVVIMVGSDSPAEKAGVEVGDVIVSVAGQRVNDSSSLRLIVSGNKPGAQIPLEVMRDNKKVVLNALLEALPEEALAAGGSSVPRGGSATSELIDGVTAQDIDDGLAKRFKLDDEVDGVVVTKVDPQSSAAEVGLQEGDVIMAINRQSVSSLDEAKAAVKGKKSTIVLKVRRKGDTMLVVVRDCLRLNNSRVAALQILWSAAFFFPKTYGTRSHWPTSRRCLHDPRGARHTSPHRFDHNGGSGGKSQCGTLQFLQPTRRQSAHRRALPRGSLAGCAQGHSAEHPAHA